MSDTVRNATSEIFEALKSMLPGLPENACKMTLTLEAGKSPIVECEYIPMMDGKAVMPFGFVTSKYALVQVGEELGPELVDFAFPGHLVHGEALAIDPDPRLDEVIKLLKELVCVAGKEDMCHRATTGQWIDGVHHKPLGARGRANDRHL